MARLLTGPSSMSRPAAVMLWTLWILSIAAFPVWIHFEQPAWDVHIYMNAVRSLQLGHDPYADAIAIQDLFHRTLAQHPNATPPFSYVYSPITLPLLRFVGDVPLWISAGLYWTLYGCGVLAQTWVAMQAVDAGEMRFLRYMAPVAVFFPGLLASDVALSGNIAYILYGGVLLAAITGWRRGSWRAFYIVVLIASCFKAPLLTLLAIPVLSARRQWLPSVATGAAGLALFSIQPAIWPSLFQHFMQAVELQFSFNRDFGVSPAGIFSGILWDHHVPYSPGSMIFFLCYAVPLFGVLLFLSRKYVAGALTLRAWMPVMLVGVILLNPRLIEYDVAPLALPMALIAWRVCQSLLPAKKALGAFAAFFFGANAVAFQSWPIWKLTECALLSLIFAAGVAHLVLNLRRATGDTNRTSAGNELPLQELPVEVGSF